ncbi:hypothetical protein BDQ17DRAFT_765907 [Cyathus striatus]|nr:hypothetical protein BDQ17DRAFT_765907 [Cyathus striatus]
MMVDTYYLAFPTDKRYLQFMVYFILATQLAQTLLCTRDAFTIFARSFGNIQVLDKIHTLWLSYPIMGGLVALIYQSFSAHRVYKCTGKKISAVVVSLLSTTGFAGALTFAIRMKLNGNLSSCVTDIHNFIAYGVWNVASATCDVVITVIMVYNLVRYTEDTEKAMLLINKIIRLTVGTGMATEPLHRLL